MNARTILEQNINTIFDEICCRGTECELGIAIGSDELNPTFAFRNVGENSSEMISTLNLAMIGQWPDSKYKVEKFKFEFDGSAAMVVLAYESQTGNERPSRTLVDVVVKDSFNEKGTFIKVTPIPIK